MSRVPNRSVTTRILFSLGVLVVVTLALGAARAQFSFHPPAHFAGLVNDFTPSNVSGGPYVMSAKWKLDIRPTFNGEVAEFSADMNMETSDYGINEGIVDPTNTVTRGAHTHNISLTTTNIVYNSSSCPANPPGTPAASGGNIMVTGNVSVTGNGTPAPFESKGPSTLQICITGGSQVPLSNLSLVFVGPATGHFGTLPIRGVVVQKHEPRNAPATP